MKDRLNIDLLGDGEITSVRMAQRNKILAGIFAGERVVTIAKKVKVKRVTIYKMMKEKWFQEKLEEMNGILHTAAIQQSCELIEPSFDAIHDQIAKGDGKLALMYLKELGVLRSAGTNSGFDSSDISDKISIVINVSGHAEINGEDNSNITDNTASIEATLVESVVSADSSDT